MTEIKHSIHDLLAQSSVEDKRQHQRSSKLDNYLPTILTLKSKGWSYQRILDHLNNKYDLGIKCRSTLMRFIKRFNNHV